MATATAAGAALPTAIAISEAARAQAPKKGGRIRYGSAHGSTTDTLDPATMTNDFMTAMSYSTNAFLTLVDNESNLVGDAASALEAKPGAKEWVFRLRKGIEFHNGKPLTADDVIATINFHKSEESKSSVRAQVLSVSGMRKEDDQTVIFELSEGNASFPYLLSAYQLAILPSTDGKVVNSAAASAPGRIR